MLCGGGMTREEYKAYRQSSAKKYAAAVAELTAAVEEFEKASGKFAAALSCGCFSDVVKVRREITRTIYNCIANVRGVPVRCVSICIQPNGGE